MQTFDSTAVQHTPFESKVYLGFRNTHMFAYTNIACTRLTFFNKYVKESPASMPI